MAWSMSARAGFTPINPPPFGEDTHQEIFTAIYGGSFTQAGLDFTNGTITATRVEDFTDPSLTRLGLDQPMSLVNTYGTDDQIWQADFQFASAEAKFAVFQQQFGYYLGLESTEYHNLFNQTGLIYDVDGEKSLAEVAGKVIRWARAGENRIVSSRPTDNADGKDHMVTYLITGRDEPIVIDGQQVRGQANNLIRWLVFFEDKFQGEQLFDFDYNDLVVEIAAPAADSRARGGRADSGRSFAGLPPQAPTERRHPNLPVRYCSVNLFDGLVNIFSVASNSISLPRYMNAV